MDKKARIIYVLCIGIYLVGFNILFSWTENSKLFGFVLISISSIAVYRTYINKNKSVSIDFNKRINIKNIYLGLLLIIVDILYNLYVSDTFGSLDQGMILSGIVIILLNTGLFNFLKLNDRMKSFATSFLFLVISIYSLVFMIPPELFFNNVTYFAGNNAAYILNLIKPTNTNITINYPNIYNLMVNFDGKIVGVGNACSGVAMLTVFLAALIAFYISSRKKNLKKLILNAFTGIIIFYIINVIRLIILILINYYYGFETMFFFHINLGWIMFVIGMGVFWYYEIEEL